MKVGQVVKIHSSRFTVLMETERIECTARGSLKIKSGGIVTGDYVEVDDANRTINKVLKRKSYFIRPNIANVDAVNIVVASPPKPDYTLLDKLILSLYSQGVEVIISVNKTDLNHDVYTEIISNYSEVGCSILQVSALNGEGIDLLKEKLKGKLVAFAGQSAVGKSSILNALFGLDLKTNDVSEKTQRGRHTTTVSEIYDIDGIRVADTPGFSVLKPDILPEEVALFYPEYFSRLSQCKFRCCTHTGEPDCKVFKDVRDGVLSSERYERYKLIYNEIKEEYNNKF